MGETLQCVVAVVIVALAVIAVARSFARAAKGKKSTLTTCASCRLKDMCQKAEKNSAKKCADKVAQVK